MLDPVLTEAQQLSITFSILGPVSVCHLELFMRRAGYRIFQQPNQIHFNK